MATYRIVKAQIAKLEKQAAELLKKEVVGVISKIRAMMAEHNLTLADLGGKVSATKMNKTGKVTTKPAKKKAAANPAGIPKYRDPASGKTWTGHGKSPAWITIGINKGKSKEDFLIGKAAPAAKPVAKKVAAPTKVKPVTKKSVKKSAAKAPAPKKPVINKPVAAAKAKASKAAKKPAVKAAAKKADPAPVPTPAGKNA